MKAKDTGKKTVYLDLHFGANNIIKLDTLSKSDPFVVVFQRTSSSKQWKDVGRTDTVYNSEQCTFGHPVSCTLSPGQETEVKFEVWDRDSARESLSAHDLVGSFETTSFATFELARHGLQETLQLVHPNRPLSASGKSTAGELHVLAEIRSWPRRDLELVLQMEVGVARRVTMTPKLQIEMQRERVERPGEFVAVHRTLAMETIDGVKTHDGSRDYVAKYKPQKVMFDDLCNDDGKGGRDQTTRVRVVLFVVEKKTVRPAVSRPVGWVESSPEDLLAADGSMRQMQVLSRPGDGLLPFGALDVTGRKGGRSVVAMADDLQIRFSDVAMGV